MASPLKEGILTGIVGLMQMEIINSKQIKALVKNLAVTSAKTPKLNIILPENGWVL